MASDAPGPQMSWLEQQFANNNIVVLIIFGICCNWIAAILAAITYFTGTDPKAKQNSLIVMIIGVIVGVVSLLRRRLQRQHAVEATWASLGSSRQ